MPSRVRNNPVATLLAVISAVLILVGRVNHTAWWGDWVFIVGIAVLVIAGALYLIRGR
jgi:hypothetical protein